jgi:high affinity sulfate transporter 1
MTTIDVHASQNAKPAPRLRMPLFLQGIRGVKDLPKEVIAGVTLAALMIPLNIGYAQVAGLPPIVGLYAAIVPMIFFAIFATSRNLIASPDAPIAALIGGVLAALAAPSDPLYVQLAFALALMCALVFFAFWFFRLGFLANFLSHAVLVGFISGLGIEVLESQIKKIMGVSVDAQGFFRELIQLITKIPVANWYSVAVGGGTIVIIRLLKRSAPGLPGALIALILMTAIVAVLGLDKQGVSVLGPVPSGLPSLTIPQVSLSQYAALLPGALAVCGVTVAEGLLVAKKYAQKYDYKIDPDQELFAFGAANVAAGLTGAFIIGSSASRTAAIDGTGARSQLPSIVAAAVVAISLLFLTPLLALLPNAALAGIVANAVLSLIEVDELRELFRMRRSEFWIAIVCLLSVLVLGALPAVIIAFLLSTIAVVARAYKPRTEVLILKPDGNTYYAAVEPGVQRIVTLPGLIIFRFESSLYFANANTFTEDVQSLVEGAGAQGAGAQGAGAQGGKLEWLVLDAEAINDIDTTGAGALKQALAFLKKRNVTFAISRANPHVPELLKTYDLLEKIGQERLYATNRDAIDAFSKETGQPGFTRNGASLDAST